MKKALTELRSPGSSRTTWATRAATPSPRKPNQRHGTTPKTVLTDDGAIPLAIPAIALALRAAARAEERAPAPLLW